MGVWFCIDGGRKARRELGAVIVRYTCKACRNNIEFDDQHCGEEIACPHCQADIVLPSAAIQPPQYLEPESDTRQASPKQIAYLSFMGVRGAERLTRDQASERIQTIFDAPDHDDWKRLNELQETWKTQRFILHPKLYEGEFARFLSEELPDVLRGYVRSKIVGASEKLTRPKSRQVIMSYMAEDANWWRSPDRNAQFLERLRTMHPGCCDGRSPEKSAKRAQPIRMQSKGAGCLLIFLLPALMVGLLWQLLRS